MTLITVLYHGNCSDGFCAAWVAYRAMREQYEAGLVSFHPMQYGQPLPDIPADGTVFMLDFSLKREAFSELVYRTKHVIVLDHHKTAVSELSFPPDNFDDRPLNQRPDIFIDVNKSGGRLAWEYFNPQQPGDVPYSPWLVDYTEDRDLWRWALPNSREVNEAIFAIPQDFKEWDTFHDRSPTSLRKCMGGGSWLLAAKKRRVAERVAAAYEVTLFDHRVLIVNATCDQSEIAGELAKGRPFGACFTIVRPGKAQYSLRSTPEGVDVSELAARMGGGGHKHAAGYTYTS